MTIEPRNPAELAIDPSSLQEAVQGLLEDAGLGERDIDEIMKMVEEAELNKCEQDYNRQQERLMEGGAGLSLREQQIQAQKLK